MLNPYETRDLLLRHRTCVIVPTYNHAGTVVDVLDRLHFYAADIIVVNDGSTDQTQALISDFIDRLGKLFTNTHIHLINHDRNEGKGSALVTGFNHALSHGFRYAVSIDADGQHYPEDLPLFAEALEAQIQRDSEDHTLFVGCRPEPKSNKGRWARMAMKLAQLCFTLQTWQHVPDLQSGYRLYPLYELRDLDFLTSHYEAELELLILCSWHGVKLQSLPVRCYQPPKGKGISHFDPRRHFRRVFALNVLIAPITLFYGWPIQLGHKLFKY